MGQIAATVEDEGFAIEYQFILAADQIGVDDRHTGCRDAFAQNFVAARLFVEMEGRGIQRQQ